MAMPRDVLPWREPREDRARLATAMLLATAVVGVFGGIVPLVDLPAKMTRPAEAPAFVRLQLEAPPPPAPVEPPPPPPVVEPVPVVARAVPAQARPSPAPRPAKPVPDAARIRDEAAIAELTAFADAFADLRDPVTQADLVPTEALARGAGEAATADRALIAADHGRRTLAVAAAAASTAAGGVALSGRENTRIELPRSGASVRATGVQGKGSPGSSGGGDGSDLLGGRSLEEVRRVFDANKRALFALYHRALRDLPGIAGKVVLELVISPAGAVTDCRVVANELGSEALAAQLAERVRAFRFEQRDVLPTTVTFPVHFLPS
jgi:TonB family protein